jgi:hypothetical protein
MSPWFGRLLVAKLQRRSCKGISNVQRNAAAAAAAAAAGCVAVPVVAASAAVIDSFAAAAWVDAVAHRSKNNSCLRMPLKLQRQQEVQLLTMMHYTRFDAHKAMIEAGSDAKIARHYSGSFGSDELHCY